MSINMLKEFEKKIGYKYNDFNLLRLALTHSSYGNEVYKDKMHNYERLEFLGDAVLEIAVSDYLFKRYQNEPEGVLTKKRACMVCEPTLALIAKEIGIDKLLYLSKGEEITGGRQRDSIISDALEAVIGSIYIDGGMEASITFINSYILKDIDNKTIFVDSKTILQERVQASGPKNLNYVVKGSSGPDHCKTFMVEVCLDGKVIGKGSGHTKKAAEQQAAYDAITKMEKQV